MSTTTRDRAPATTAVRWRLLQPDTVEVDREPVALSARSRSVLVCLLLAPNEPVSMAQLADHLWGDDPPKTARNSVARFVADLRGALHGAASRVVSVPGGYRVVVLPGELDIDVAQTNLDEALRLSGVDDEASFDRIRRARDLVGEGPNPVLNDAAGVTLAGRLHQELRTEIVAVYAEVQLRRGEHRGLVGVLERAVDQSPFDERLWCLLMTTLHRSGRSIDALRAFQRLVSLLDDVGMVPGTMVRRMEAEVLEERGG